MYPLAAKFGSNSRLTGMMITQSSDYTSLKGVLGAKNSLIGFCHLTRDIAKA
jgi:hypothetical protein